MIISSPPPNNRVLKSGDTMTGKLTVSNSGGNNAIDITSSGGPSVIRDTSGGNGLSLQSNGQASVYGKLRLTENGNGWADVVHTCYFQADTSDNSHNLSFLSGDYGADSQFNRLQFCSALTTITEYFYTSTPAPTAVLEIIGTTATKVDLKVKAGASQGTNIQEWQNSGGTILSSVDSGGNLSLGLGQKLKITTGSNASVGKGTLTAGSVVISTSAVTANSLAFLTDTGTAAANTGALTVGTITAGTSFQVLSTNTLDTSTFNWWLIN